MKRNNVYLTAADWELLEELEQMPDEDIDTDDIPEVMDVRNLRRGAYPIQNEETTAVNQGQDVPPWCISLHEQLGGLFQCLPGRERVQIRTPFTLPDGDMIDLYWRDTPKGQVISDLGDTRAWLFVNGDYDELTTKKEQAIDQACSTYGVERHGEILLARVENNDVALAIVRLVQAVTVVSQSLDVGADPPSKLASLPKNESD